MDQSPFAPLMIRRLPPTGPVSEDDPDDRLAADLIPDSTAARQRMEDRRAAARKRAQRHSIYTSMP